jgi:hypothetical protein
MNKCYDNDSFFNKINLNILAFSVDSNNNLILDQGALNLSTSQVYEMKIATYDYYMNQTFIQYIQLQTVNYSEVPVAYSK